MKVLFYYRGRESIGIQYLMSLLERDGHEVALAFDPGFDSNHYLTNSSLSYFNFYKNLVKKSVDFKPDLIAVSVLTNIYPFVCRFLADVKKQIRVPVIAGGPHVTSIPEYVLSNDDIDMVCLGEGEEALVELVARMTKGEDYSDIKNIWLKKNGKVIQNELRPLLQDLDALPFPDKRHFFNAGCFTGSLLIMASRGCSYRCTYCHNSYERRLFSGKGKYLRRRSIQNVLDEIEYNRKLYRLTMIRFMDDDFVEDEDWVLAFLKEYTQKVGLPFTCNAGPMHMNSRLAKAMRQAGCLSILMGLESGDEMIRRQILKRPHADEDLLKACWAIKDEGILLQTTVIFGLPNETREQMWKTVDLVERSRADIGAGMLLYPFPSTDIFDLCVKDGFLDKETVEKVKRGEGGFRTGSLIFDHPDKDLAESLSRSLLMMIGLPPILRNILKDRIAKRKFMPNKWTYTVAIVLFNAYLGREGLLHTFRTFIATFLNRNKKIYSTSSLP